MSIDKKIIYTVLGLMACVLIFTCTKVSFDDPFTGDNAEAVPIITLIGPNPYFLNVGDVYEDPGATAIDTADIDDDGLPDTTDLTDRIVIKHSTVSTDYPGEHIVKYYATNDDSITGKAERVVEIIEVQDDDNVKPVITLNGLNPKRLFVGETYTEKGATAHDNKDGDITDKIERYGDSVTTEEPDTFNIWYMVDDSAGNIARKKRSVYVLEGLDDEFPILALIGNNRDSIYVYEEYVDPGATAYDSVDGDLTDEIVTIDSVDNTVSGIYRIHYSVSDKAENTTKETRYIYVFDIEDTIPPVITLLGDTAMKVGAGGSFMDPGATAIDNVDGDISVKIHDTGSVDMQKIGSYTVYYNVADIVGNQAVERKRTVNVVDTIPPSIHINPPNPVNIFIGTPYHEWGATAHDNLDGDITHKLVIVGYVDSITNDSVDVTQEGQYRVHYIVEDNAGYKTDSIRIVNVNDFPDTVAPVITLEGDNPMILYLGDPYDEPGAKAWDNKDGDVTDSIKINSDSVNTSNAGTYRVHYTVTDKANNPAHEIRTVNVGGASGDSIIVGTGTDISVDMPVNPFNYWSYTQSIWHQDDINVGSSITIDTIYYYYYGSPWSSSDNITVYMANTTKSYFSGNTDWISVGSMTPVYSGTFRATSNGWIKIVLDDPFVYNNNGNLVIAVDENSDTWHGKNDGFYCIHYSTTDYRSIRYGSDDSNPNPSSPPTATTMSSHCPKIKIKYH